MMKKVIAALLSVVMLLSCGVMCISAAEVTVSGSNFKATLDQVNGFMAGKTVAQRQTIYDFLETYVSTDMGMDTLKKFRNYVDKTTEQALHDLLARKSL